MERLVLAENSKLQRVEDLRFVGVNPSDPRSVKQQQFDQFKPILQREKGNVVKITVSNAHATNAQDFIVGDSYGCAAAASRTNGANIAITTSFPGGHTGLKELLKGSKLLALGCSVSVSDEAIFDTLALKYGTGNLKTFSFEDLSTDLEQARDTQSLDPKTRLLKIKFALDGFSAFVGSVPALSSVSFYFQVPATLNV